jgi:lysozyme
MISNIQDQLERDEGKLLMPYRDTRGFWTIGIGHLLGAELPQAFEQGISEQQCQDLFAADLHHVYDLMDVYLGPWWQLDGINGPRSGVLLNLAFNLGTAGLSHFHEFLGFMRAKDWEGAAADLEKTPWYHQVGERAPRLCRQIREGAWQ